MQLRLLEWETDGVPVLKVLTDEAFEGMIRSIDGSEGLTPGEKGQRKGMLCTMNTGVTMNGHARCPEETMPDLPAMVPPRRESRRPPARLR